MVEPTEKGDVTPESVDDPAALQFPSDANAPKVEIAERTADSDKDSSTVFTKDFVVLLPSDNADLDQMHTDNKRAVYQEAIQRGLHPKAEAKLVKSADHAEPNTKVFTYTVKVTPAHVDDEASDSVTPTTSKLGDDAGN